VERIKQKGYERRRARPEKKDDVLSVWEWKESGVYDDQ